jgi:hypothetical protein
MAPSENPKLTTLKKPLKINIKNWIKTDEGIIILDGLKDAQTLNDQSSFKLQIK